MQQKAKTSKFSNHAYKNINPLNSKSYPLNKNLNKETQHLAILEKQHGSKVKTMEKHKQRTCDI